MMTRLLCAGFLIAAPAYGKERLKLNLVIIAIDGLRADHLGAYGYSRPTSPNIDSRSKQAVVFERAVAQATWTLPSFTTLFSSRYPHEHQVLSHSRSAPPEIPLLAEVLRNGGYRTAGFVGGHYLDPCFGLARGFEHYRSGGMGAWRFLSQTIPQAVRWIQENGSKPFFVFVHGNDVHPPFDIPDEAERSESRFDPSYRGSIDSLPPDYTYVLAYNRNAGDHSHLPDGANPPESYFRAVDQARSNRRDMEHLVAHYDDRILAVDAQIETLFRELHRSGRDQDTIVVLMADHGLEFGEKGKLATAFHSTGYDSVIHVPLMIWAPKLPPRRVSEPVQLVDLAPTLLELIEMPAERRFHGRSFVPLAKGADDAPRHAFSESSRLDDPTNSIKLFVAEDRRWKLVVDPAAKTRTLFDLSKDPGETVDVLPERKEEAAELLKRLETELGHPL